jgi:hypothetical protein
VQQLTLDKKVVQDVAHELIGDLTKNMEELKKKFIKYEDRVKQESDDKDKDTQ